MAVGGGPKTGAGQNRRPPASLPAVRTSLPRFFGFRGKGRGWLKMYGGDRSKVDRGFGGGEDGAGGGSAGERQG